MASKKLIEFPAVVHINDAEQFGEGGRLVLHALDVKVRRRETELRQVETIINAETDAFLQQFPTAKGERARRKFRIVVYDDGEFTPDELAEIAAHGG